jgi:hypothetical protein
MPHRRFRILLCLLTVALLAGCAHRLKGPIHSAEGPPFGSIDSAAEVAPLEVRHRIILIGDAGYYLEDDPTLDALGRWAESVPSASVVFLGDNIYNEGLTDDDRERGEQILAQQLAATDVRKIFIPGNHDWGLLPRNYNARAIENQQRFVDEWADSEAEFVPKDGCMGPATRVLRESGDETPAVVLVAVDPTPWIKESIRDACPRPQSKEEHLARLDETLARHEGDVVIAVSHYPMLTGGPHGGLTYGVLVDMIVTPLGWMMGGLLNTYEDDYADWIEATQDVFRRHPPAIYAAGHDHNLQLLESEDVAGLYVVSGAGARERVSTVTHLDETIFAHAAEGFVVVDIGQRGPDDVRQSRVVVRVVEPMVAAERPVFEMTLR